MKRKIIASLASVGLMTAALSLPAAAWAAGEAEAAAAAIEVCWDVPFTDWEICVTLRPK